MASNQLPFAATVELFSQKPRPAPRRRAVNPKLPNQYFLFCRQRRTTLQAEHPGLSSREVTRILAEEWKQLLEEEKAAFSNQYQENLIKAREENARNMADGK
jgi:hypothetical protein